MEPVEPRMAMRFDTKIYFTGGVRVGEWAEVTDGTSGLFLNFRSPAVVVAAQ
jgi:hypothetical protein